MTTQEKVAQAFDKFVVDREEGEFVKAIIALDFWKSPSIDYPKARGEQQSEANKVLNQLVEYALREPAALIAVFVAIEEKLDETAQRIRLVSALYKETRSWHISYVARRMGLDQGRKNIVQFLASLYLHSLISIGEIRATLDDLIEYNNVKGREAHNASVGAACFLLERIAKKFVIEERSQFATKEAYESKSFFAQLEKAKFTTEGDVRSEIDTQLKYQWMYVKDYNR